MKRSLSSILLAFAASVHTAGCGGGGNTVELPENPDPMPSQSPVAAGQVAPGPQAEAPSETVDQE